MRRLVVPITLLLFACRFDDSTAISDGGVASIEDAQSTDSNGDTVLANGFENEYENWQVPESGTLGGFKNFSSLSLASYWFVADINNDGKLDLVQTLDPDTGRVWETSGKAYWAVFLGEASSFASEVTRWHVPESSESRGFFQKSGSLGAERWDTVDVNGDGCEDFVRLLDPATGNPWADAGAFHWEVFLCSTAGFSESASIWSIPDEAFARTSRCTVGDGCWDLADMTGDGIADLIQSSEPGSFGPFDDGSSPYWRVYAASVAGYAAQPALWAVPTNEHTFGFFRTESVNRGLFWRLIDLDGDDRVELVQTCPYEPSVVPEVYFREGHSAWHVFRAETSGFAGQSSWDVPLASHAGGFFASARSDENHQWSTVDIDGDGSPDLVHTANSAAANPAVWGSPDSDQWKVYRGGNGGFSDSVVSWRVPDSGTISGFFGVSVSNGGEQWSLLDLDGDGQVELVQAADPETGEIWLDETSNPFWRVYRRATSL